MKSLQETLDYRRATRLYRERLILDSPQGAEVVVEGRRLISFCSNDYLGLANDPRVIAALAAGAHRWGVGSGASHLVSGHSRPHHALEEELAAFVGSPRALLFSTGYMANLGVAAALAERHGVIYEDRLNHASLIDAARLTRAKLARFPHADVNRLQALLAKATQVPRLILTDAVFSMDGDLAPLGALTRLAQQHGARLLVDDAHGLGVLGESGRGTFEHLDVKLAPPAILMGTLGKAFGTFGAFVAAEADLIEILIQQARTYIYTTALPPAVAEATRAGLKIVRDEPWRRTQLHALVARFRRGARSLGFALGESETPIQPLILGAAQLALDASRRLRDAGILVPAIRPPTVPKGRARLRITFSAVHTEAQVDRLLDALATGPRGTSATAASSRGDRATPFRGEAPSKGGASPPQETTFSESPGHHRRRRSRHARWRPFGDGGRCARSARAESGGVAPASESASPRESDAAPGDVQEAQVPRETGTSEAAVALGGGSRRRSTSPVPGVVPPPSLAS